jgi:hypothetical protein
MIPFDDGVIVVRSLNGSQFSSRLSEIAQSLDSISGIQLWAGSSGLGKPGPFGAV